MGDQAVGQQELKQELREYADETSQTVATVTAEEAVVAFEELKPREKLVACLRAEVAALDEALREEIRRRKELEHGLRNWRLAREAVDASRAEQLREEMERRKEINCALTNYKLAHTVLMTLDVYTGESI
jgi:hypothetical protein